MHPLQGVLRPLCCLSSNPPSGMLLFGLSPQASTPLPNFGYPPGELHAFHPTVQQLRGFVSQQRASAEAALAEREVRGIPEIVPGMKSSDQPPASNTTWDLIHHRGLMHACMTLLLHAGTGGCLSGLGASGKRSGPNRAAQTHAQGQLKPYQLH